MSCDDCYRGYSLPGTPSGQTIDGAYLAPAPDPTTSRKSAVVYLTDAFGFELNNPQLMADHFAKELNLDVWVPDIFAGEIVLPWLRDMYISVELMYAIWIIGTPLFKFNELDVVRTDRAGQKLSAGKKLQWLGKIIVRLPRIYANRSSVVDSRIRSVRSRSFRFKFQDVLPYLPVHWEDKKRKRLRKSWCYWVSNPN